MKKRVLITAKKNVPPGQVYEAEIEGENLIICQVSGQYYAVSNLCPHKDFPLSDGYIVDDYIVCPLHGSAFNLQTGKCMRLPASESLKTYAVLEIGENLYVEFSELEFSCIE